MVIESGHSYYYQQPPALLWLWMQVGVVVLIGYGAVALASALYYLTELAEEYARATQRLLRWLSLLSACVQCVLLLAGAVPLQPAACGIAAQAAYLVLLQGYPFVELASVSVCAAVLLFIADNALWGLHFTSTETPVVSPMEAAGFYATLVWPVPSGLFLSLCLPDQALPGCGSLSQGSGTAHLDGDQRRRRRGMLAVFDAVLGRSTARA
eukprot:TRINITY_DN27588_c0_g1_i1.p1 TRINITY_DN27588_c0_g1~~TRINITY_DN27588_c0_g1_i1.p1  ORF type:complete len:210 (+),score=66.97 TRINITY_DN27588_c0_g1_i1:90-719(+)